MSWCGAEEPLQPNQQLFAVEEESRHLRLSDFSLLEACRYSFTHLRHGESPLILGALAAQATGNLCWVLVWKHDDSGPFRTRSQIHLARLRRQGFQVATSGCVGIAQQPFSGIDTDDFRPTEFAPHPGGDGVFLLVESEADVVQLFMGQAGGATLMQAVATGRFAPSRPFLSWMVGVGVGIMYVSHDQLEHAGLVLVRRTKFDLENLTKSGVIVGTLGGLDAQLAWRHVSCGPNSNPG